MSSLTEDQKRKIEENRKIAVAKRAAKAAERVFSSNCNNSYLPLCSVASNTTKSRPLQKCSVETSVNPRVGLTSITYSTPSSSSDADLKTARVNIHNSNNLTTTSTVNTAQNINTESNTFTVAKSKKILSAACTLISRSRFRVDCGYNPQLQSIFKTIPSSKYDVKTKTWNFDVSHHDQLIDAVRPLQPDVVVGAIPSFVFKMLNAPKADAGSEYNENPSKMPFFLNIHPNVMRSLLPFQLDGVKFGISVGGRILIADDMGLGKTIQAIAIADHYRDEWPVLVVTPSSVRYSWFQSFRRWLPDVPDENICIINSSRDNIPSIAQIVIIGYEVTAKRASELSGHKYRVVIMDESHFLKNIKSARTKAAFEVTHATKRLLLLSGTPALSRPAELYPQLHLLDKRSFNSFIQFGIRYCNAKKVKWGNGWDFKGSSNMEELQIILSHKVMIRRLKSEVMSQLPVKQREMIVLDPLSIRSKTVLMKEAHKKVSNSNGSSKHGALLQYFSETAHSKLEAVKNYVQDLLEGDVKFLCFAHHQVMMDNVCSAIDEKKVKYIRIDGSTSAEKRKDLCHEFQHNDHQVAVLSITAANAGITLTAAALVVFCELFWNPGILTQAEDRVHRIGQEQPVVIQYLVAKKTADDFIWPLVQQKLDVLNKAGLSKDCFSNADTKHTQKNDIKQYFIDLDGFSDDDIFDEDESKEKRIKYDTNSS